MADKPIIVWFRRDLRLADHPALDAAAASGAPIIPVYILDDETAGHWRLGGASRWWLAASLRALDASLRECGSRLILRRGEAVAVLAGLAKEAGAGDVCFTRGYEPFHHTVGLNT
jgi:deoxyribodipyrimidine photo-lyase